MILKSLKVYQVRNLKNQSVDFSDGANFFIGPNGAGKTSLVEAVSLLGVGRSFRTSSISDITAWNTSELSVFGTLYNEVTDHENSLGLVVDNKKRKGYVDDQEVSSITDFIGRLKTVSFSPTDIAIVKGGPAERRKFIDKHIVEMNPNSLRTYLEYTKALNSKNSILRSARASAEQLSAWNRLLARSASEIWKFRKEFLKALEDRASKLLTCFTPIQSNLAVSLQPGIDAEVSDAEWNSEEKILEELGKVSTKEIYRKTSLIGPHRDEIVLELDSQSARKFASQGQSRSIVLALKLGVMELLREKFGENPIVLLDDVDAELDEGRRKNFYKLVIEHGAQLLITGTELRTDLEGFKGELRLFNLISGEITGYNKN